MNNPGNLWFSDCLTAVEALQLSSKHYRTTLFASASLLSIKSQRLCQLWLISNSDNLLRKRRALSLFYPWSSSEIFLATTSAKSFAFSPPLPVNGRQPVPVLKTQVSLFSCFQYLLPCSSLDSSSISWLGSISKLSRLPLLYPLRTW